MFNSMMQVATLFGSQFSNYMFISFAPPKETNQRKGGPNRAAGELGEAKCQLQPKRALATQAFMRYRFGCSSHHFVICPRALIYKTH